MVCRGRDQGDSVRWPSPRCDRQQLVRNDAFDQDLGACRAMRVYWHGYPYERSRMVGLVEGSRRAQAVTSRWVPSRHSTNPVVAFAILNGFLGHTGLLPLCSNRVITSSRFFARRSSLLLYRFLSSVRCLVRRSSTPISPRLRYHQPIYDCRI